MRKSSDSNIRTECNPHNKVHPRKPPSRTSRAELTDYSWPFLCSFALHALLFAILFNPAFQYPIIISSQTPAIYWFSMITHHDNSVEAGVPPGRPTVASAGQQEASDRETPRGYSLKPLPISPRQHHPVSALSPVKAVPIISPARKVSAPLEPESPRTLPEKHPAMAMPVENRSPSDENLLENESALVSQQIIEQKLQAAEKFRQEQLAREQESRAARYRMEQERVSAEKARQQLLASENELQKLKQLEGVMRKQEKNRGAVDPAEKKLMAYAAPPDKTADSQLKKAPVTQKPVQANDKPMSVSLPQIKGDLKLIIAGNKLPETTITFKDFALSRRDRPFSRAESLRNSKIVPLIADSGENTREVIIVKANPGVYTITIEPAGEVANIELSLKLYEGTSRAITRTLGKHAISYRQAVCKILMPDGIFWDDNSAFSGNMEDSDGITKFNSENGLMWKEYND